MSGSDWVLVSLIVVCVGAVTLTLGYLWGMHVGLAIAEHSLAELHDMRVKLAEEGEQLRTDLTRQLNRQLELE